MVAVVSIPVAAASRRAAITDPGACAGVMALACRMRLCFALLPVRTDHHDHVPPVLLGLRLDEAELFNVAGETLQQTEPQLGPRLLTSPEHDRHLDLVARLEEPLDVALLGAVVVRVDLRAQLDLLDDRLRLVLARFPGLDRGLVLE